VSEERIFEAPDPIEVMDEAVQYNRYLIEELLSRSGGLTSELDFGAGSGRFASALHDQRRYAHAIEPGPDLRKAIEANGVSTLESIDRVENERFQGIYPINVLEHVQDDAALLSSFFRCLKPDGRFFRSWVMSSNGSRSLAQS